MELAHEIAVDLRATDVRVRLDSDGHAEAVSLTARDLGLVANPVLQDPGVVIESRGSVRVRRFWQCVLEYAPAQEAGSCQPSVGEEGG